MTASYDDVMASLGLEPSTPKRGAEHEHGDHRRYLNGCRCGKCRAASRRYQAAWRARKRSDPSSADRLGHGKTTTYRAYGCRCEACRAANTEAVNAWRARRRERAALAKAGGASC